MLGGFQYIPVAFLYLKREVLQHCHSFATFLRVFTTLFERFFTSVVRTERDTWSKIRQLVHMSSFQTKETEDEQI